MASSPEPAGLTGDSGADGDTEAVVDAVLAASRAVVAVATRSLGAAAEETTLAQYRALVVLISRGPQRMVDLARALAVSPSTAGRMCDRLLRKGMVRRYRTRADRREVLVSITAAGRDVVGEATRQRRVLLAAILANLSQAQRLEVASAFATFAAAAGEVPDDEWPTGVTQLGNGGSELAEERDGQAGEQGDGRPGSGGRP